MYNFKIEKQVANILLSSLAPEKASWRHNVHVKLEDYVVKVEKKLQAAAIQ